MRVRVLLPAVCLAVFAQFAAAAPPQVTFAGTKYTVSVTPGATIAYVYAFPHVSHGSGVLTDSDGDGIITIDVGGTRNDTDRGFVAVDLATAEYAALSYAPLVGLSSRSILPGPSGAFTELVLVLARTPVALWVRPGVGVWAPAGKLLAESDGSSTNDLTVSSIRDFQPLGSSPARPDGFARGDLFFHIDFDDSAQPKGGLVDAKLDEPNYAGAITFPNLYYPFGPSTPVAEGQHIVLPVLRLLGTVGTVSVRCCKYVGSATPGLDFTPVDSVVTFGPGELVKQVIVPILNDGLWALPRSVAATLYEPVNTVLYGGKQTSFLIEDDDPKPVLGIEGLPASVTETDAAQPLTAIITVTGARREPVTVRYSATGAGASTDLVFQPGETRKEVVVTIPGNDTVGRDYTFGITLRLIETEQRVVQNIQVIDDELPSLTLAEAASQEGTRVPIQVTMAPFPVAGTLFKWKTVDGTAKAGTDYVAASGTYTYPAFYWDLSLLDDSAVEGHETFYIELTDVRLVTPVSMRIAITIYDDDGLPPPTFANLTAVEGNTAFTKASTTMSLPAPLSFPITYDVKVDEGTATWITDFTTFQGPVTFQAGETSKSFLVQIVADKYPEPNETFTFSVDGTNSSAVFTIVDDDTGDTPNLIIEDATVVETTGADTTAYVRVSLSAPATHQVFFEYKTASGTATTGLDFRNTAWQSGFQPGETVKQIAIGILGDGIVEPDERFTLTLSDPRGATLIRPSATITIVDDDSPAKPGRARSVRH
jgi:Calx-beta domain